MKDLVEKIKATFFDIVNDFWSTIKHGNDLIIYSSTKRVTIFFLAVLILLFIVVFNSNNQAEFYINLFRVLSVSFATFFIFCISDYFWFLIKRNEIYKWNIKHKKRINILLKRVREKNNLDEEGSFEDKIISIARLNSRDYKYHTKRYAVEICFLLFILAYIDPIFFIINLFLFGGMFFWVSLCCEQQSIDQAFSSISTLLYCIDGLHRENPNKCKKFVTESKLREIKDLTMLYQAILKHT